MTTKPYIARIARSSAVRRGKTIEPIQRRGRSSAEATEQALIDTARRIFADKGYIRTTVQDIIEATGLSRGAFYLYFRSTDDIFVRMITRTIDELVASSRVRSGETLRQRVYDGNLRYLEIFGANRGVMRALFEAAYVNPDIAALQARMRSAYLLRVRDHLARQVRLGRCHPIDPDAAALSLGMMVEGAAQSWAVLGLEPFEQPVGLVKLCTQVTEIWCRAVYLDPDRPQSALTEVPLKPVTVSTPTPTPTKRQPTSAKTSTARTGKTAPVNKPPALRVVKRRVRVAG